MNDAPLIIHPFSKGFVVVDGCAVAGEIYKILNHLGRDDQSFRAAISYGDLRESMRQRLSIFVHKYLSVRHAYTRECTLVPYITVPPLTARFIPVMNPLFLLSKNAVASAASSTVPSRRMGMARAMNSWKRGSMCAVSGVDVNPGETQLIRIHLSANSTAMLFDSPNKAYLALIYGAQFLGGTPIVHVESRRTTDCNEQG